MNRFKKNKIDYQRLIESPQKETTVSTTTNCELKKGNVFMKVLSKMKHSQSNKSVEIEKKSPVNNDEPLIQL